MSAAQLPFDPAPDDLPHRKCPDGGMCHHECWDDAVCFRVRTCEPLSGTRLGDRWRLAPAPSPDGDRPGLARRDHPATSRAAAQSVMPRSGTARRLVLDVIVRTGPSTDDEIQSVLGMNPSTQRPRRVELVRDGWLRDSGGRRPTRTSGEDAIVWELARPVPEGS